MRCSRATFQRVLDFMRQELEAPIEYDRKLGVYRYNLESAYELPGIFLSGEELAGLAGMAHWLAQQQTEFLNVCLQPALARIERALAYRKVDWGGLRSRIRYLPIAARNSDGGNFRLVMEGLLHRKKLMLVFESRDGTETRRTVSPLHLVRYRDNWYLDAYCHLRQALRCFGVDRIHSCQTLDETAEKVPQDLLDAYYADAYGIFSGHATGEATILFHGNTARQVSRETWHPLQKGQWKDKALYYLSIPYSDPRELIMDIMRYGPEAEIISPPDLRTEFIKNLKSTLNKYSNQP